MSTVDERNAQTSRDEVAAFMADAPGPYFAYYATRDGTLRRRDEITTWVGDKLGDIIWVGEQFRSAFGDWRQNFRARGINGTTYSGTAYLSAGDYVRMRPVKS